MPMINRNGDRGSPCLTPLKHWNSKVDDPFTRIDALDAFRMLMTQSIHCDEMFIWYIVLSKKCQFISSKLVMLCKNDF